MSEPPVTDNFLADVAAEADYQVERWGAEHDAVKDEADWYWTLGYIAGKAIDPAATLEKRRHRLRAAAALLKNWDRHLVVGSNTEPGT